MDHLGAWLQICSAICAFVAAGFWAWSAVGKAPEMTWAGIADLKPWLDDAARRNRWAASFAGLFAALDGLATLAG